MNDLHNLGAAHALFHTEGSWFHRLEYFPAILCGPDGFVRFETKEHYEQNNRITIYDDHTIVHDHISQLAGYLEYKNKKPAGKLVKRRK